MRTGTITSIKLAVKLNFLPNSNAKPNPLRSNCSYLGKSFSGGVGEIRTLLSKGIVKGQGNIYQNGKKTTQRKHRLRIRCYLLFVNLFFF